MKYPYFQETWLWQGRDKTRKKGVISLVAVFTLFVFTVLGLGMLYLSQIYLKFSAFKKNSILLDYSTENGIKQGFHQLLSSLSQASSLSVLTYQEAAQLKAEVLNNKLGIIERFLRTEIPLHHSSSWENLSWKSETSFSVKKIEEKEDYVKMTYQASILSEGKIKNFPPRRKSILECGMDILAGNIPLPEIPLLIDKKLTPKQKEDFEKKNNIDISTPDNNIIPPQITFAEEELLPEDANSQLMKALKIKMFSPQNLSDAKLRVILGLEETDEPVPEGVYLIKDDLGLGGVFVQGDVDEMILAIEGDFQVVSFVTESGCWVLKFSPSKGETIFTTPLKTHYYNLIPLGIIFIDGEIHSLGGGIVHVTGEINMVKEEVIPSILGGVNLTIVSSKEVTISSHLIHQGLKWQEGVPYLKDSQSQLIIYAAGEDPLGGSKTEGGIVIDENSPDELKIQASLTASGKGLTVEGKEKNVHLMGSLQTSDLSVQNNNLKITFNQRLMENDDLLQNAPKTRKPIIYLASFKAKEWREL
jgi:hypothetical protein